MRESVASTARFRGARIALLEARMSDEMEALIRRFGGIPYSVPAVREERLDNREQVAAFIDALDSARVDTVIFLTGAGVTALLLEAERLQRKQEMLEKLRRLWVVCRGPKPAAVLRSCAVPITLNASEPYTTQALLAALQELDLRGSGVAVVHYGERSEMLVKVLRANGARFVEELLLYAWRLPPDTTGLEKLVQEIIGGCVEAVVFTSQIQVRHLWQIAGELKLSDELSRALQARTIVASIGPTCTAVLESYGVRPRVVPAHPKMGHLVKTLVEYMDSLSHGT
jgi:uroporphyrinogen-III synthase